MQELNTPIQENRQYIDVRPASAFQTGHLPNSLNIGVNNLATYGESLWENERPIVFILSADIHPDAVQAALEGTGHPEIMGYIRMESVPAKDLVTLDTLAVEDFMALNTDDYQLLDVRTTEEITRQAPTKNLVHLPLADLAQNVDQLDPNTMIYTLCGSGNRATIASSLLKQKGFNQTTVLEDGMKAVEAYRETHQNTQNPDNPNAQKETNA